MADVTMPQLGETVTEGTITRWLKSVGDTVARDEPLFEVSTDKVDSEVPSPASGVLTAILVEEGDTVEVGVKLATIGDESAPSGGVIGPRPQAAAGRGSRPARPAAPPAPAPAPATASGAVPADRPDAARQSPPVAPAASAGFPDEPVGTAPVPSRPPTGAERQGGVGATARAGSTTGGAVGGTAPPVASADRGTPDRTAEAPRVEAAAPVGASPTAAPVGASPASPPAAGRVQGLVLSPVVRKILDEHGIDPRTVTGTGLGGRITRDDAAAAVAANGAVAPQTGAPSAPAPPDGATPDGMASEPAPVPSLAERATASPARPPASPTASLAPPFAEGHDEVVPFTNIRRRTAEHMVRSKATSAHTLMVKEIDYERVEQVRRAHGARFHDEEGFGLSYLPFAARAAVEALVRVPPPQRLGGR